MSLFTTPKSLFLLMLYSSLCLFLLSICNYSEASNELKQDNCPSKISTIDNELIKPSAELIYFTTDGKETSPALIPNFKLNSIWSGLGMADDGNAYVSVSNHQQPGGNAAIFKYDTCINQISFLNDIKSVSLAENNWMKDESQHKVHTFLMQHADGKIYFASDDYTPSPFLRGAHLYSIDPTTEHISDFSKTQPFLMEKDFTVIENTKQAEERSGIAIEWYGIKGMSLNKRQPSLLYFMTYPEGHIIQYTMDTGAMQKIGQSDIVSYVTYADNFGNLYYARSSKESSSDLELVKFVFNTGETKTINASFPGVEIGAIAPTEGGKSAYILEAKSKDIYSLDTVNDTFQKVTTACGANWWQLYNLSLSPNGKTLYYVSNNNSRSTIQRIDTTSYICEEVLDIDSLLGTRNLSFGGINMWDREGNLYAPVWTLEGEDVALLKVALGEKKDISEAEAMALRRVESINALFSWAEQNYPMLFLPSAAVAQLSGSWRYVYYSETKTYIGVNDSDEVWVLGDVFGGLLYIDTLSKMLNTIGYR